MSSPNEISISLCFTDDGSPQLQKVECVGLTEEKCTSLRGRNSTGHPELGAFLWSPAVHALSLLLVLVCAWRKDPHRFETDWGVTSPTLEGEGGSPASSLDYALSKQPNWLANMFGTDIDGNVNARQIFARLNPERKRPGPVVIHLNQRALENLVVEIQTSEPNYADLRSLFLALKDTWRSPATVATRAFTPDSPPEAALIASAKPEKSGKTLGSLVDEIQRRYIQIWEESSDQEEALKQTAEKIGQVWGHQLLYLSSDCEVNIINEEGDVNVQTHLTAVNIGKASICGALHEVWLDPGKENCNCDLFAANEDGIPLKISILQDRVDYKLYFCHFPKPLQPLKILRYSYGYQAQSLFSKGMSVNSHYWDFRIGRPMNFISLSLRHRKGRTFKGAKLVNALNDEFITESGTPMEVDYDGSEVQISWSRRHPLFGQLYRTYWEFYP